MGTFRVAIELGDPTGTRWLEVAALAGLRLAADPVGRRLVPVPGLLLTA